MKKPAVLTDEELVMMKAHPVKSERIVLAADLEDESTIATAVRHHHERFTGGGYPDGLSGEAIPILSRIVAVADTYDAMARLRVYRLPQPHEQIMNELRRVAPARNTIRT